MSRFLQTLVLILLFSPGYFFSCTSSEKKTQPGPDASHEGEGLDLTPFVPWKGATQVSEGKNNWDASFSPDGKKIRFSSSQNGPEQADIYEINLDTGTVDRLTFQTGLAEGASYVGLSNAMLYRSNIDELKERPKLFEALSPSKSPQVQLPEIPPLDAFELYYREDREAVPKRLTQSEGFDGFASLHPDGNSFIYTSEHKGRLHIRKSQIQGRPQSDVLIEGEHHIAFAKYSPDGEQIFWIQYETDSLKSHFYLGDSSGQNAKLLASFEGMAIHPLWHPDGEWILFSGKVKEKDSFAVYSLNPQGPCINEIYLSKANLLYPNFSPDGKRALLTVSTEEFQKLFLVPYDSKTSQCQSQT